MTAVQQTIEHPHCHAGARSPAQANGRNWAERSQALREALQQIEAEIPRLCQYARYLGREPHHADELVQKGLVRAVVEIPIAIAKIPTEPPGTSLRGRPIAILRSCHIDEIRLGQHLGAPASTGEASSLTNRRNQQAGAALAALCDAYFTSAVAPGGAAARGHRVSAARGGHNSRGVARHGTLPPVAGAAGAPPDPGGVAPLANSLRAHSMQGISP